MTDEEKIWSILKDECVTCNYPEKVETGTKCEDCCFRETNPNSKATWNVEPIFDYYRYNLDSKYGLNKYNLYYFLRNGEKPKGLHLHHIDCNHWNDRENNHILMTPSDHMKLHRRKVSVLSGYNIRDTKAIVFRDDITKELLENAIRNKPTIQELCKKFDVTKKVFKRLIKDYYNEDFYVWWATNLRIEDSKKALDVQMDLYREGKLDFFVPTPEGLLEYVKTKDIYELNDIYAFFQNNRGRNWYKYWIIRYLGTTVQELYKEYGKHPDEKFSMDGFIKYLEKHQDLSDEKLAKGFFDKSRTFMYNWIKRRFNSTLPKLRQLAKKGD